MKYLHLDISINFSKNSYSYISPYGRSEVQISLPEALFTPVGLTKLIGEQIEAAKADLVVKTKEYELKEAEKKAEKEAQEAADRQAEADAYNLAQEAIERGDETHGILVAEF